MLLIVEGIDRVGKDTLINNWCDELKKQGVTNQPVIIHFGAPPAGLSHKEMIDWQRGSFLNAAKLVENTPLDTPVVWNRSHIGEWVYGEMYRNSYGEFGLEWLWSVDQEIVRQIQRPIAMLLMLTNPEWAVARDDGYSFSIEIDKKWNEIERFIQAYRLSIIKNKDIIWQPKCYLPVEEQIKIVNQLFNQDKNND